jgi:predicted heme/steroid binding protein
MSRVLGVLGGSTLLIGGSLIAYDYQTCSPMRKFHGWELEGCLCRLHNELMRPTNPFTLEQLAAYDGKNGAPLYFSVEGVVYDVSSSEMFKSSYSAWAGKDATVSLATMSLEEEDVGRMDWDKLTAEDRETLDSWIKYFDEKYYIQGRTVYNKE